MRSIIIDLLQLNQCNPQAQVIKYKKKPHWELNQTENIQQGDGLKA